tara:strand:- start:2354 stop:2944 length:591 start_codon:yes stop_codon:yes gene_type:complete
MESKMIGRIHSFDLISVRTIVKYHGIPNNENYLKYIFDDRRPRRGRRLYLDAYMAENQERRERHLAHKELMTIRLLRFFLKKGQNPNNEDFLKILLLEIKLHSDLFFRKILYMCINYGLDFLFLDNLLNYKNLKIYDNTYRYQFFYEMREHTSIDTVKICKKWISKNYRIRLHIVYKMSTLKGLNDDVIDVISEFL